MRLSPRLSLALLPATALAAACIGHGLEGQSNLVVANSTRCTVSVSVDGWDAASVRPDESQTVDNIGAGRHVLEVKDDSGQLLDRRYIELAGGESYRWNVDSCAPRPAPRATPVSPG